VSQLLKSIDSRTQMAGQNRMELLLFRFDGPQRFGINVFKVREIIPTPILTKIPRLKSLVRGLFNLRQETITVIDLSLAIQKPPLKDTRNSFLVIADFSQKTQAFLVKEASQLIHVKWEDIHPPSTALQSDQHYVTATTCLDDELIHILDVEKVMFEVNGIPPDITDSFNNLSIHQETSKHHILFADDSAVVRKQIKRMLDKIGVQSTAVKDGKEALDTLTGWAENDNLPAKGHMLMVISDIEMPEMDGYTLTRKIRQHPQLKNIPIVLHTSLSGNFNVSLTKKVGADEFIPKWQTNELAQYIMQSMKAYKTRPLK